MEWPRLFRYARGGAQHHLAALAAALDAGTSTGAMGHLCRGRNLVSMLYCCNFRSQCGPEPDGEYAGQSLESRAVLDVCGPLLLVAANAADVLAVVPFLAECPGQTAEKAGTDRGRGGQPGLGDSQVVFYALHR